MAALTNFLEDALIGHLFRGTPYTAPATLHVALLTAAPGEAGGGTEVAGSAYARVAVANASAQWNASAAGNGTTANTNVVTFPVPSAGWGIVSHFAVYDAATAGNMLWYGALTLAKTVNSGDTVSFPAGTLSVQVDN